jgi:hypothetical protein
MPLATEETIGPIIFEDVTGQKTHKVRSIPSSARVDEVVRQLLGDLQMPHADSEGRPLSYAARLERDGGRILGSEERVGEALEANDSVRLLPSINAACSPC